MKIKNILVLITLVICTQLYAQSDNNSGLITNNLDNQKKELELIKDDYQNGKQLISEYYDLVYKAIEKGKLELFEDAISKVKQANTLLGHAYTKEKAYQNLHPEYYNPVSLQEYKRWVSMCEGLASGSHIEYAKAIQKAETINEANSSAVNSLRNKSEFWVHGNTEECGSFYDMKDCGANPVCLKIRFCVISETSETITVTAEVQPKNVSVCMGSSNNDPIKIYYDGNEAIIPRSEFKANGFKTNEFTVNKSIPFGDDGFIIWNREDLMFEFQNDYPTNGWKTTAGVVIDVDC